MGHLSITEQACYRESQPLDDVSVAGADSLIIRSTSGGPDMLEGLGVANADVTYKEERLLFGEGGEVDPNGINANAPGAKLDAGKVQLGMVLQGFNRALKHVAQVGTKGAIKYSKFGFLEVDGGQSRYTDAMFRHWFKECTGEVYDMIDEQGNPGTEELHAACVSWNALAGLEFILMEKEKCN